MRGKSTLSLGAKTHSADTYMHTLTLPHRVLRARLPYVIKGNVHRALITKLPCSSERGTISRQAAQTSSCHKAALPTLSCNNLFPGLRLSINYACISIHSPYVWVAGYVPYHEGYGSEDLKVKGAQPHALLGAMPSPTHIYISTHSTAAKGVGSRSSK